MNKQQLTAALESIGMRPGRGLGQNFLLDGNLLDYIVRLGAPRKQETILEVGPGFGALTRKLLKSGAEVYAVEFDHRIAEYLRRELPHESFHLTEADACRVNYLELLLSAGPGTKNYGALSVRTQLKFDVKLEKIVPPDVFFPPPEVDSAIVSFRRHDRYANDPELCRLLPGVVKNVFAQRRKQLGKVLSNNYGKEKALPALEQCGIATETRPDRLTLEQFVELVRALFQLPEPPVK